MQSSRQLYTRQIKVMLNGDARQFKKRNGGQV